MSSLKVSLFTMILTGVLYPVFVLLIGTLVFHKQASGSLVFDEHRRIVGSELIGQNFHHPGYFFPRPSEAGKGYDGLRSSGSNLSPASQKFVDKVQENIDRLKILNTKPLPLDLVTSSGSGLDPHISPQAAYWQAPKIALQRNVSLKRIMAIIDDQIQEPQFYIFGTPRVNVLKLNLALDQFLGSPATEGK